MTTHRRPLRGLGWALLAAFVVLPLAPASQERSRLSQPAVVSSASDVPAPVPPLATQPPAMSTVEVARARTAEASQVRAKADPPQLFELLQAVGSLEENRRQTGEAILARLKANLYGSDQWEVAVQALGQLRYDPAARYLVEHITVLRKYTGPRGDRLPAEMRWVFPPPEVQYPAIRALWSIGYASVDPLIKAYLPFKVAAGKKPDTHAFALQNIVFTLSHAKLCGPTLARLEELEWAKRVIDPADPELAAIAALREVLRDQQRWRVTSLGPAPSN